MDKSIEVKIGNYKKTIIQGNEIDEELPYLDFPRGNKCNNNETFEFQERMGYNTIFKIPNSNENDYNDLLGKELKDKYVGIRVLLLHGNSFNEAVIKKQKQTADVPT